MLKFMQNCRVFFKLMIVNIREMSFIVNRCCAFISDRESVDTICRSLVESHHRYCVWKFMIIPESSVQLTDIYSNETVNRFIKEAEEFLTRIQQIEIIGQLKTVRFLCRIFHHVNISYLDVSNRSNRFRSFIKYTFERSSFTFSI